MTPDEANEDAQYTALAKGLNEIGVNYIHILGFTLPDALLQSIQNEYKGTIMLNGGYTADRAASDIQAGKANLISFGNTYISNPDLVSRMQQGAALTPADPNTFYTPGAEGYNDYATL